MSWSPAVTGTLVIVVGLVAAGLTVPLRRRFPQLEEVGELVLGALEARRLHVGRVHGGARLEQDLEPGLVVGERCGSKLVQAKKTPGSEEPGPSMLFCQRHVIGLLYSTRSGHLKVA